MMAALTPKNLYPPCSLERCGGQENIIDPNTGEKTGSVSISEDGLKKACYIDDRGIEQCIQVSS